LSAMDFKENGFEFISWIDVVWNWILPKIRTP
jgi:hypothetical protein